MKQTRVVIVGRDGGFLQLSSKSNEILTVRGPGKIYAFFPWKTEETTIPLFSIQGRSGISYPNGKLERTKNPDGYSRSLTGSETLRSDSDALSYKAGERDYKVTIWRSDGTAMHYRFGVRP